MLPKKAGAGSIGPLVLVRQKYILRGDEGIIRHELEHVKQWWRSLGAHGPLYLFVRRYRLWSEVEAYRAQMAFPDGKGGALRIEKAAQYLSEGYGLGINPDEALVRLRAA